ncbi:MAG TPA: macro domain-containing protein [Candidatus Paceibacterota bacterium]|nr:macro domain-containing protein [Candidatus Paceibacterota bacterium]
MKNIQIIHGDITYPKSISVAIPANLSGLMTRGVAKRIVTAGWQKVAKEAKKEVKKKNLAVGDVFITDSGRLKRRGAKHIFHLIIRRTPGDFTTIDIVSKSLYNALDEAVKRKIPSISICGIGIEGGDIEKKTAARITVEICEKYSNSIEIKIIDEDEEFISNVKEFLRE